MHEQNGQVPPGAVFRDQKGGRVFVLKGNKTRCTAYIEARPDEFVDKACATALRKEARALRKSGDGPGAAVLEERAAALKTRDIEHPAGRCDLLRRNSGMVYLPCN